MNYVVDEMRPLATVEKKSFRNMLKTVSNSNDVPIPSVKNLKDDLKTELNRVHSHMKEVFAHQKFVCTTADVWSARCVSYLGMTVHFIDEQLKRHSFALCFRKLSKRQTFDYIAKTIFDVHNEFGLPVEKITHTVTDGGSNFCKAFRLFQVGDDTDTDTADDNEEEDEDEEEMWWSEADDKDDDNDEDREEEEDIDQSEQCFGATNLGIETLRMDFNAANDNEELDLILPRQMRCCSHLLNLICTTDLTKYLKAKKADSLFISVFRKLKAFWRVTRRSVIAKQQVFQICGVQFPIPVATRWNSTYDALRVFASKRDAFPAIFDKLELVKPNVKE